MLKSRVQREIMRIAGNPNRAKRVIPAREQRKKAKEAVAAVVAFRRSQEGNDD